MAYKMQVIYLQHNKELKKLRKGVMYYDMQKKAGTGKKNM